MKGIIAAIRTSDELDKAIASKVEIIFLLNPNIFTLKKSAEKVHESGKKLFVHIDLAEGIGKDEAGIKYIKELGADGIISTRQNIIKTARKENIHTVQRFFIVDSHSVETTLESVKAAKPDTIEIMPGIAGKIIKRLRKELSIPVVAGGLIETEKEAKEALSWGADAVSAGNHVLWDLF